MYQIEELEKRFKEDYEREKERNKEIIKDYQENYPNLPIPDHLFDDFSVTKALQEICKAIMSIRRDIYSIRLKNTFNITEP